VSAPLWSLAPRKRFAGSTKWVDSGGTIALPVKLVSYDQRGHRRLGALIGGRVVDLPDAVGHPVFPTTMEALVSRSGGTVLDAARDALDRDDALECAVPGARLLAPLLPASIRTVRPPTPSLKGRRDPMAWYGMPGYVERDEGAVAGPDQEVPARPERAAGASLELWLACIVGLRGRDLSPEEAGAALFGYTLMAGWNAPGAPTLLGPCIVTADELEPGDAALTVRVGGDVRAEAAVADQPWPVADLVAHLSWNRELAPGDVLGSAGVSPTGAVPPGSLVEMEAAGIGILRSRIGSLSA